MELRRYAGILWRRKFVVIIATLIAVAVVGLGTSLMPPTYSASSVVRVAVNRGSNYAELNYADRLMSTYVYLLKSRPYLQQVIDKLGLATDPKGLQGAIDVQALPNSELIRITADSLRC